MASFDERSFSIDGKSSANAMSSRLYGRVRCLNTKEEFHEAIKPEFMNSLGEEVWNSICSDQALKNPEKCLSRFGLLVYGDLKRYNFDFMFAYPALIYPDQVDQIWVDTTKPDNRSILAVMNETALSKLQSEFQKSDDCRSFQRGFFIVTCSALTPDDATNNCNLTIFPLDLYDEAQQHCSRSNSKLYFAFSDPSGCPKNPGWPLRNYIALIWKQFKLTQINIIRIRNGPTSKLSKLRLHHSMIMNISIISKEPNDQEKRPRIVGWEADDLGKISPRAADVSRILDPKKLANDAVDLNLRLMKWRLMPALNLEAIATSKCLLIGCGTLGCHVARGLLAWGVKNITLVDNGKVSFSNPVRQSLYFYEDCPQQGCEGAYKAETAAKRLLQIHPTVNVAFKILSIPMPGYKPDLQESAEMCKSAKILDELILEHDTIFLMTDTRESRWLPTVIAMAHKKLLINSAIGFDTFLIQRHAIRDNPVPTDIDVTTQPATSSSASRNDHNVITADNLGCYFCNDIVAPGNSTLDRTLDQQCTVTRPGVSMLVSALVVELYASIMSSPLGPGTPARVQIPNDKSLLSHEEYESDLGIVPHSIRGDISRYHIYMPTSSSFNKCCACSPKVIDRYLKEDEDFCKQVFLETGYLEQVSGLKELHNFDTSIAIAFDSDEDFSEDS